MRVLFIVNMWPTDKRPQFGSFIASQAKALEDKSIHVDVLKIVAGRSALIRYASGAWELVNRIRSSSYDVLHAHYGYCIAMIGLVKSQPTVGSFCGSDLYRYRERVFSAWAGRRIDVAVVKNQEMRSILKRRDAIVLPNGVDMSLFHPRDRAESRRRMGFGGDDYQILFPYDPGRPEKRFSLASAAVEYLNKTNRLDKPVRIFICFDAPLDKYLDALSACDALIMTSRYEGSPNCVKEAMACNLPVISVPVGDVPELLRDICRSAVCSENPKSLGDALSQSLMATGEGKGRERIRRISSGTMADKLISVYECAIQRYAKGPEVIDVA